MSKRIKDIAKECRDLTVGTEFFNRLYRAAKKAYYETPSHLRSKFKVKRYEKETN